MTSTLLALIAGTGTYLLYTAIALQRRSLLSDGIENLVEAHRTQWKDALSQAGMGNNDEVRIIGLLSLVCGGGAFFGWLFFGGIIPPLLTAVFAGYAVVAAVQTRITARRSLAAEAWPRMIEEVRMLCGSLGRPIPQALLEVGKQGPSALRPAFVNAEREWLMSTDFSRTIKVLKDQLADPTADATCETLLVAHNLGGNEVQTRLAALAEDRRIDLIGRKTARAKQAGVRFARRFVLIVPLGMALAGMSIGNGRAAYETATGQIGVAVALVMLAGCWWWAGRLIRLPQEERVFRD